MALAVSCVEQPSTSSQRPDPLPEACQKMLAEGDPVYTGIFAYTKILG